MADRSSHEMLTVGDPYYAKTLKPTPPKRGAAYGSFVEFNNDLANLEAHPSEAPIANSPATSELREAFARDMERQTEQERVAKELLALAPNAPEDFFALVYSYPHVAAYLLPIFEKAGGDVEG